MKKYYWLKLKDDFFTQKAIKKLRKIAGGDTFTIIYLKMMLVAIKSEGKIFHEGIETNFHEELALDLDEDEENVKLTISYLLNHGLMEESQNEYFLPESITNTGSESDSAERVRRFRRKSVTCNSDVTSSNALVTTSNAEVTTCNTEKEIEIEIEKEKRERKKKYNKDSEEILSYLNLKSGSNYRMIDSNLKLIDALINKGYSKQDVLTVIDKKTEEWNGTDYQQYLRPMTLFGNKFESYLNQPIIKKQSNYERTTDKLTELFNQYGGEENEQTRDIKNIFNI